MDVGRWYKRLYSWVHLAACMTCYIFGRADRDPEELEQVATLFHDWFSSSTSATLTDLLAALVLLKKKQDGEEQWAIQQLLGSSPVSADSVKLKLQIVKGALPLETGSWVTEVMVESGNIANEHQHKGMMEFGVGLLWISVAMNTMQSADMKCEMQQCIPL